MTAESSPAPSPRFPRPTGGLIGSVAATALLIVAGIVCLVLGWPERHPWQRALLQLSGFAYAAAGIVALVRIWRDRLLHLSAQPRPRIVWRIFLGLVGAGVLVAVLGFLLRHTGLVPFGQFLVWLGLGIAFFYVLLSRTSRAALERRNTFRTERLDDNDLLAPAEDEPLSSAQPVPSVVTGPDPDKDLR